mgnify:CR=1 FL=1
MLRFGDALLREHYAHIASKPFFPEVQKFMQQTPVIALAIEGDNAVARVRDLLGPTDSKKAAKGTIRGDFGVDVNVAKLLKFDQAPSPIERLLIEAAQSFNAEYYLAITIDRTTKSPLMMLSAMGGDDIEEVAADHLRGRGGLEVDEVDVLHRQLRRVGR